MAPPAPDPGSPVSRARASHMASLRASSLGHCQGCCESSILNNAIVGQTRITAVCTMNVFRPTLDINESSSPEVIHLCLTLMDSPHRLRLLVVAHRHSQPCFTIFTIFVMRHDVARLRNTSRPRNLGMMG
jgi:hypothetical protein